MFCESLSKVTSFQAAIGFISENGARRKIREFLQQFSFRQFVGDIGEREGKGLAHK
jgi:hypothetical protein